MNFRVADFFAGIPEQAHPTLRLQHSVFDDEGARADVLPAFEILAVEEGMRPSLGA